MEAVLRPSLAKFHGDFVDLPVVDGAVFVTVGIARSA
jgi:hypothetical protein